MHNVKNSNKTTFSMPPQDESGPDRAIDCILTKRHIYHTFQPMVIQEPVTEPDEDPVVVHPS